MCVNIPQQSSDTTKYTAVIVCPIVAGLFTFETLPAVQITRQASLLYRVESGVLTYSVPGSAFVEALNPANPAGVMLATSAIPGGEFILNNKLLFGSSQEFPLNSWRRAKSSGEPLWIRPSGIVDPTLSPSFAGATQIVVFCSFLITTITDRDFLTRWSEGCV